MVVTAINAAEINSVKNYRKNRSSNQSNVPKQPSFQGLGAVLAAGPIAVSDLLYRGGYITSFMLQDFFGMAGPRTLEGMNRRPINPETGKKEGPYNWKFARREGLREVLSGPSAYVIPLVCLHFIKKYSGSANNVPINMIQGIGNNFVEYAVNNKSTLADTVKTRRNFYNEIFRNVLNTTLQGKIGAEELSKEAEHFTNKVIEIEQAKDKSKSFIKTLLNKRVDGSPQDLTDDLIDDFMRLKKKYLDPSTHEMSAEMTISPEKLGLNPSELTSSDKTGVSIKKLIKSLTDFTDDVVESTGKAIEKYKDTTFDPKRYLNDFVLKRTGSRILTNIGMWSAVVGFYMLIPTLYSLGLKGQNPSFANEKPEDKAKTEEQKSKAESSVNDNKAQKKQSFQGNKVSFSGREKFFKGTAEKVLQSGKLKGIIDHFEFDDAAMSVSGMMALLYGFCLPTRLIKAPDKYDFNETIKRDLVSFTSILIGATALSRGFSALFSKLSGLVLSRTPNSDNKSFFTTLKNYFSPIGGIEVLSNKELKSKYTNVQEYKDGIKGFFDFVTSNRGNLKKLLQIDKTIAENVKIILGKDLRNVVNDDEIKDAFRNIKTEKAQKAKEVIENVFKNNKNKIVQRAKFYNSSFAFLSTICLVPAFMIWLARSCEKMTRKARERDAALNQQSSGTDTKQATLVNMTKSISASSPNKITMQGFLAK